MSQDESPLPLPFTPSAAITNEHGLNTETWRMAGNSYHVIQGRIIRATLHGELISNNLPHGHFTKYFFNRSGNFGITFDGCDTILLVLWHDVIHYLHVVVFFALWLIMLQSIAFMGRGILFKTDPKYAHHVFQLFLKRSLHPSTDEHLKLIVNFLLVSGEFLEFVLLYQSHSIIIETGYKWFAPIWKILDK